jgi:hypothetical protein
MGKQTEVDHSRRAMDPEEVAVSVVDLPGGKYQKTPVQDGKPS